MPAGLPPAAAKYTGLPKYNFTGGNNDSDEIPLDGLIAAANAVLKREGRTLSTYGLASGPQGYRPLREFLVQKLKRDAGITCTADEILVTSGSLQALDLVNGVLLSRGDTVIIEQECYQGSINRLTRLGVNMVGIPLDRDGMRMDALANALDDLKRRGIRPKYIYTIPTVQNPTGTILPEVPPRRDAEARRGARRADLRGRLLRRPDLGPAAAAGAARHERDRRTSSTSARSRSRSRRRLRVGYIVAPWAILSRMLSIKTDAGSGAVEQMMLAEYCAPHFAEHVPVLTQGPAQKARHPDGGAERAVRHRGRVRRAEGRHLPLGQAAGQRRHA